MLIMKVKKRAPRNAEASHKFADEASHNFVKKLVSRTNIVHCLQICALAFLDRFGRFSKATLKAFENTERKLNISAIALLKRSIIYNIIRYYNSGRTRPPNINLGGGIIKGGSPPLCLYPPLTRQKYERMNFLIKNTNYGYSKTNNSTHWLWC